MTDPTSSGEVPAWLAKIQRAEARKRSRSVPMPLYRAGGCRWCRGPLTGRRTSWHPECFDQYTLHTALWAQRRHVEERDGNHCAICRSSPIRCLKGSPTTQLVTEPDGQRGYIHYHGVSFPSALQVDHITPLWALSVLPRADRIPFFGPSNLRLLCPDCHKAKTKREAQIRATHRKSNQRKSNGQTP